MKARTLLDVDKLKLTIFFIAGNGVVWLVVGATGVRILDWCTEYFLTWTYNGPLNRS